MAMAKLKTGHGRPSDVIGRRERDLELVSFKLRKGFGSLGAVGC